MSEQKTRTTAHVTAKDRHVALGLASLLIKTRFQFLVTPSAVGPGFHFSVLDVEKADLFDACVKNLEARPVVDFYFDGESEYGKFGVVPNGCGATLAVNGRTVGVIDMFREEDGTKVLPAFIFDDPGGDDVSAKVVIDGTMNNEPITVIVNGDFNGPTPSDHPRVIHSDGRDHVFQFTGSREDVES